MREERCLPGLITRSNLERSVPGGLPDPRNGAVCSLTLLIFLIGGLPSEAQAGVDGFGPYPVRNFQPFQLLFLGMFGDRAIVIPKHNLDVRIELANTATIFDEQSEEVDARVKAETLRTGVFLRYGLTERLEVGIEIPLLYRHEGFMEGLITFAERATTGLSPAREALKDVGYAFNVTKGERTLFSGTEGAFGLGDITLISKYQILDQTSVVPALSLRLGVKLPTGDEDEVFSSGHPDVGLGLALEKKLATRWIFYVNINEVFPTGDVSGLTLDPFFSSIVGAEYLWTPRLSLVLQFDYYSTPYSGTGVNLLDRGVTELATGFSYELRNNLLWQVYGVENVDFITGSAADFTLSTLVTYHFGS